VGSPEGYWQMFGWFSGATARAWRSNPFGEFSLRGLNCNEPVEPRVAGLVDFADAAGADGGDSGEAERSFQREAERHSVMNLNTIGA
jgi:hypothetical protein